MNKLKKYEEYTNEEFARLSYEEKEEIKGRYYLRKAGKFTVGKFSCKYWCLSVVEDVDLL